MHAGGTGIDTLLLHIFFGALISPSLQYKKGDWSSGMIPALGAGGREFDSRITPLFGTFFGKQKIRATGVEPVT